ncbi:MAG: hypothetical protein IT317_01885 [Anaerolineales bacterium]|nr:hypothetical protein [Anaerolineales bacterium]
MSYNRADDLPPDARGACEQVMGMLGDQNRDGRPDMFEGMVRSTGEAPQGTSSSVGMVNGQVVPGSGELPPEMRAKLEQLWDRLDTDHSGVPDVAEAGPPASPSVVRHEPAFTPTAAMAPYAAVPNEVSPEGDDNRLRLALIAIGGPAVPARGLALPAIWALAR